MNTLEISDEILCAYIDNELDEQGRLDVERAMNRDDRLAQRLRDLTRADLMVRRAFQPQNKPIVSEADFSHKGFQFTAWLQAGALVAATLAGVVVGINLQNPSVDPADKSIVVYENLEALPIFQETMEKNFSGTVVEWKKAPDQVSVLSPTRTYRAPNGTFCRRFELVEDSHTISGLVCRNKDGHWDVNSLQYVQSDAIEGISL